MIARRTVHEVILRNISNMRQTVGNLFVFDGASLIFHCKVLELPYKENKRNISCIPAGYYNVSKHYSRKFGNCFVIENVPGRHGILQHPGNYTRQIQGCQLLGESHTDMDNDGLIDVTNSRQTIKRLYDMMPEEFPLRIMGISPKSGKSEKN